MLNKDFIAFRKGMIVINNEPKATHNASVAYTLQAELMRLGYMFDNMALDFLYRNEERAIEIYNNIIPNIKDLMADGYYIPLYSGFPQQVMNKSDLELFIEQIMHYMSDGTWIPNEYTEARKEMFEHTEYKVIKLATEQDFNKLFTNAVSVNQSLTPFDKEMVEWFAKNEANLTLPEAIPFKETLCMLASLKVPNLPVKTPTDVLRIAVHLSGGDISLPAVPKAKGYSDNRDAFKFKKFTRAERKYLLSLLENSSCDVKEMKLKLNRWIRLGEIIHPSQYQNMFPKSYEAFNKLRNDKVVSWYGEVEPLLKKGVDKETLAKGLQMLSKRPGEFARKLDSLLSKHDSQTVLNAFAKVAHLTSNKVLFELYNYFLKRDEDIERTVFIKGAKKPTKLPTKAAMSSLLIEDVKKVLIDSITKNMAIKTAMEGKYVIDERLKQLPTPTNMRSMSDGLMSVPRGARIGIGDKANCLRFYVHWVDKDGREDLDLSAQFYSEDFSKNLHIAFNGNLNAGTIGCHSGDVQHRRGNCAEYIDIRVKEALNKGFRYIVMDVYNYEGRALNTVQGSIGWMERENPEVNKTWYPQTVKNSIKLDSKYKQSTLCVIDLLERELIYIDEGGDNRYSETGHTAKKAIARYVNFKGLSVYDVLKMNIEARGGVVVPESEGFDAITDENGVTTKVLVPKFEYDTFMNDYMQILKYML